MQERSIDPAERFKIWRLLARTFPFFKVSIMALLTIFRSDKDFLNFSHPVDWSLSLGFLHNAMANIQADETYNDSESHADDLRYGPSASQHHQSRLHPTK